ncbi:PAS domain-containing sensor histidine kinase [Flavobacterium glaciei]|uniref:histidine kinase n=1 Tax=Flavobacterium glaciei TaxID=386300 RepID=A0A562PPU1_9FLAO|nr:PAS domain-containing sensor histidine kinase [Flavobacterium glaciei]RDI53561.1 PAS domain S-box-containing protein [Flavobacterium glaciei]TWI46462.1 two-component system CheB/CheR fusion protein [Flavobacterium glaciei]
MSTSQTKKVLKEQYVPTAEFYSQIIDSLEEYSIFTVDTDLNINSWNSGATNIFQYETDEIIGKPFETIFTKEDKKAGIPQIEIDLARQTGRSTDIRWHVCRDGKTFFADGLVFPLKDEDDDIIGFVKILRDITAQKKSEDEIKKYAKELEELNAHKENVLAILSHDLRSPLAGIIQGAQYLEANFDTIKPALAKELLKEFHLATINELNMLDYLVEWTRIKYAAEAFVPTKIELVHYVQKVFDSLKETASINTINLHSEIEENCNVFADEKMLLSILQNIVSNAIKHSHNGGKITLSAKQSDDMMIIVIKDSGKGMSKEIMDKLFAPQVKSLSKAVEENKGAGIGLLLVKGFLEKNNGKIWVESEEGNGSTFYFTLPINEPDNSKDIFEETATVL